MLTFVNSDALQTHFVYDWRLEQEARLRESRGTGMTDAQVIKFVDGCRQPRGSSRVIFC